MKYNFKRAYALYFIYSRDNVSESFLALSHDMPLTHYSQLILIPSKCCYIYLACFFLTD
jgi:hypothetical protein